MNPAAQAITESPQTFETMTDAVRVFGALGLVLALVLGLAWLVRRGTLKFPGGRAPVQIRVESAASLGERRSVVIVSVEGRRLLLGLTPMQVSHLADLGPSAPPFAQSLDSRLATPGGAGQS